MKTFDKVKFKWTFRDYQQRVLDSADEYLLDGKINVVAAPGSGKTILGLELIRRLNAPCIILSPTTTIRQQWGERFAESFMPDGEIVTDYVSYNLNKVSLINSVTYQALYSAMDKIKSESGDETVDYSDIDMFALIKSGGIKTICLDEAHHLQNEWQKALERFVANLDRDVKIISLTATPPYDAKTAEWDRYISVCGEIDDEIFVPELVKEGALCPHQDYIIFNYPSPAEINALKKHRENVLLAVNKICALPFAAELYDKITSVYEVNPDYVYANYKYIAALLILINGKVKSVDKNFFKRLTGQRTVPPLNTTFAERAVQFLLDDDVICSEDNNAQVAQVLKEFSLSERRKAAFNLNDKLQKSLVSSVGKLKSIVTVAQNEHRALGDKLRMLVLTDYIKKESAANIGKDVAINNISVVSIFEELRKSTFINLGVVSGSLVILPSYMTNVLVNVYGLSPRDFKSSVINGTQYSSFTLKGSNKDKVTIVSKVFEDGYVNILIGTQALLGEGWDSPCINSLILASYVGSFMLSNQMRGRAIRTYKKDLRKTANIWHLVTLEPNYVFENDSVKKISRELQDDGNGIVSYDYDMLCRRFECFVGPNYDTGEIENGIERITFIKPPYTKENFESINAKMLQKSNERERLFDVWQNGTEVSAKTVAENDVPKQLKVPAFTYINVTGLIFTNVILFIAVAAVLQLVLGAVLSGAKLFAVILLAVVGAAAIFGICFFAKRIAEHISPTKSVVSLGKAILAALKSLDFVQNTAKVRIRTDRDSTYISMSLNNATIKEQNIFNTAMKELLSPIDNPRYVIVKKGLFGKYDYKISFACPSVIGKERDGKEILSNRLQRSLGSMEVVYCHSEKGRKIMTQCRKKSFVTQNDREINKRQRVDKFV